MRNIFLLSVLALFFTSCDDSELYVRGDITENLDETDSISVTTNLKKYSKTLGNTSESISFEKNGDLKEISKKGETVDYRILFENQDNKISKAKVSKIFPGEANMNFKYDSSGNIEEINEVDAKFSMKIKTNGNTSSAIINYQNQDIAKLEFDFNEFPNSFSIETTNLINQYNFIYSNGNLVMLSGKNAQGVDKQIMFMHDDKINPVHKNIVKHAKALSYLQGIFYTMQIVKNQTVSFSDLDILAVGASTNNIITQTLDMKVFAYVYEYKEEKYPVKAVITDGANEVGNIVYKYY